MPSEILVPVNLSDRCGPAIEHAVHLAAPEGASVVLLHVIETLQDGDFEEATSFYQALEKRARARLDAWQKEFADRGCPVESEIVFGNRGRTILQRAGAEDVALVVLGSHRLEPDVTGGGLGTLSHQVALLAPCSVLLLR